jgi:hypothetical protein
MNLFEEREKDEMLGLIVRGDDLPTMLRRRVWVSACPTSGPSCH